MSHLSKKDLAISPAKRALLERLIQKQGLASFSEQAIPRRDDRSRALLSLAQQRLWFINELSPGNPAYNDHFAVRLTGEVNLVALQQGVNEILRRQESLRTTFGVAEGQPLQFIATILSLALSVVDLRFLSAGDRQAQVERLAIEEARRPFDLAQGPLLRVTALLLDEYETLLLLTVHHIVSDGWSLGVFVNQLGVIYEAFCAGEYLPLPELPIQYGDFAQWQQKCLTAEVIESHLSYWKEKLADAQLSLALPIDRQRPAIQTFNGVKQSFRLPASLSNSLRNLSQQQGVTLFMVLLAALKALLYRYTGQKEIVVGTPIAGRNHHELKEIIGCFANVLVLRTAISGNLSFLDLLGRVKETSVEAYEHETPFEKLVETLQPERDLGRTPLVQVMLVLQNFPIPDKIGRLNLDLAEVDSGTAKFDLTLEVLERPDGLSASLKYSADLFNPSTIARMIRHLQILLDGIVANPRKMIGEAPLMSEQELKQIIVDWNDTWADYPESKCIHELFEEQVERSPEAVAVVFEERRLTYGELNEGANRLAHRLRRLGVGPDTPVVLFMERSPRMLVALLGVLKAGGAYVPMDTALPRERLRFLLGETRAPVLITREDLLWDLPERAAIICLNDADDFGACGDEDASNPVNLTHARNLAYIIYTSGSTGAPKGVMVQHGSVANLAMALSERIYAQHSGPLRIGLNAPLIFDASVKQIVQLLRGHTLHIFPEEVRHDVDRLLAYIREQRLHTFDITPSQLGVLMTAGLGRATRAPGRVNGSNAAIEVYPEFAPEFVLVGGEAIDEKTRERMSQMSVRFYNVYGPTECTVDTTACQIDMERPAAAIGRPLSNVETYILDAGLAPVPVGVVGELHVGGMGLARGYLNRPNMTAERFIPHPFGDEPGGRLYRTGDLTRYLPCGTIEYTGRLDQQVKIRGFRIELEEIESALRQEREVVEVVVVAREDAVGDKRLVAYYTCADEKPGAEQLRAHLAATLPGYMMPTAYVQLERLPLTPSGKLDRKALPAPEAGSAPSGGEAPRTPVEAVLAGIWAKVLRRELVGRHDNFFELGGHSLLATQVISRMRRAFGRELPLRTVFEHPTIAALAASVEAGLRGAEQPSAPPLTPAGGRGPMPLSYAQERLWFLDQLEPGSANYNIPLAVRLTGELNREALERSLEQLMERHQALRTRYDEVEGEPAQVIEPAPRVELAARAVSGGAALREELEEFVREPFDLRRGPVLRARLWRISEQEHVAAVSVHHIAFDGWSAGVMISELGELYACACERRAARLPELPVQYVDYAVWQRGWLAGEALERELDYWRRQLEGYSGVVELPCDHARPAVRAHRGGRIEQRLSAELSAGLRNLSRREGATLFLTLLGGLDALLYHYTGQRDVAVGTAVANRTRVESEGLIGFFVNTLVLRAEVRPEESFRGLLGRVRERGLEAHLHQDVPFEKVVEAVDPERDLSRTPLFQVMLVVQNAPAGVLELPGVRWETEAADTGLAKFDLTIEVTESGDEALVLWEYDAELFEESRIERMAGHYERLLGGAVADVETPIRDLPLLSEAEEKQLLGAFS